LIEEKKAKIEVATCQLLEAILSDESAFSQPHQQFPWKSLKEVFRLTD